MIALLSIGQMPDFLYPSITTSGAQDFIRQSGRRQSTFQYVRKLAGSRLLRSKISFIGVITLGTRNSSSHRYLFDL